MRTSRYVVDSWAWVEYLDGTQAGNEVRSKLEKSKIFTNSVTIAEVISRAARRGKDPNVALEAILSYSDIVEVDETLAKEVGLTHAEIKKSRSNFSLADAFALQTARRYRARVLTGDPDFKGLKEATMIK